jgi:K+-transporting ATPase c subunit
VIGTDIVRFDIYGPDVLIANKMESGGMSGRINLSVTTKELLEELETCNYTFEENKVINIKSLNVDMPSYFLMNTAPLDPQIAQSKAK